MIDGRFEINPETDEDRQLKEISSISKASELVDLLSEVNECFGGDEDDMFYVVDDLMRLLELIWTEVNRSSGSIMASLTKLMALGVLEDMPEEVGNSRETDINLVEEGGNRRLKVYMWYRPFSKGSRVHHPAVVLRWDFNLDEGVLKEASEKLKMKLEEEIAK